MALHLRKNFARGILSADIDDSVTQVVLNSGHSLPVVAGNFPLAIWDQTTYPDPSDDINLEFVLVSYSGVVNTFNIVRAQEDTSAVAHSSGDRIALHYTAGMSLNDLLNVDHGSTSGLAHDDHAQYHNDSRAGTWLAANHEDTYTHADIALNTSHKGSSGADHSYIDQDVSTAGSPSFVGADLTGITDGNVPQVSASGFADSSVKQDGTDIKIGGDDNYTSFSATGVQTMTGTARVHKHFRIGAASFFKKDNPPAEDLVGITPVLLFDPGVIDEQAYYSDVVPFEMLAGSDIEVEINWCYEGGQDNGTVVWGIEFINTATGEAVAGGTTTITGKSAGTHTTGVLVRTAIDDVANIAGSVAHDILTIRIYRDSSDEVNDTLAVDACLVQVHLHFVMDKIGEPT